MIPLLMLLRDPETESFAKANWVLLAFICATGIFFAFFSAKYLRLAAEQKHAHGGVDDSGAADHVAAPGGGAPNSGDAVPHIPIADASTPLAAGGH